MKDYQEHVKESVIWVCHQVADTQFHVLLLISWFQLAGKGAVL